MKFYELEMEERVRVTEMIQKIIGTRDECTDGCKNRTERIKARFEYEKLFEKLANLWTEKGDKALALAYTDQGAHKQGVTPQGKTWTFEMNSFGWTQRTHHCGSLYIEGQGCIFTSGTIVRAFERILEN